MLVLLGSRPQADGFLVAIVVMAIYYVAIVLFTKAMLWLASYLSSKLRGFPVVGELKPGEEGFIPYWKIARNGKPNPYAYVFKEEGFVEPNSAIRIWRNEDGSIDYDRETYTKIIDRFTGSQPKSAAGTEPLC